MEGFDFITALGLIAGVLTTIAYLPQLIKTWKTKSAHDLSWSMLIVLCTGIILWLVYGFYIQNIPIIAANIVTFLFASMILVLKIMYKQESEVSTQDSGDTGQNI
jgi:MtN3 and saliva related transmembrane protein